jgi:hypothetical protein
MELLQESTGLPPPTDVKAFQAFQVDDRFLTKKLSELSEGELMELEERLALLEPQAATVAAHGRGALVASAVTLAAALALATCSAAFSIYGLTAIFAGAFWPIIGMGAALECGKLSAVAWLGRRQGSSFLVAALVLLIGVLMALNSIGVYGFLSRAHIAHAVAGELIVDGHASEVDAQLSVQAGILADIDRRIGELDDIVKSATTRGYTKAAMALVADQERGRSALVTQRTAAATALAGLKMQQASVDGERRQVEADLGPVRFVAALLGSTDDATMRWFILIVALLLDPAAVLLLVAATASTKR